jgi:hypothetical protein
MSARIPRSSSLLLVPEAALIMIFIGTGILDFISSFLPDKQKVRWKNDNFLW